MSADQPVVAALKLAKALLEGDEVTARKQVTKSAWKAAVGPVWQELSAAGWHLSVEPQAKALGGRAVVRAEVHDASGAGRGWRYVLLGKRRTSWRVDALSESARHAYVFLDGRMPALPRFAKSSEGRQFVEELVHTLATDQGGPLPVELPPDHPYTRIIADLRGLVLDGGHTPSVAGVKAVPDLDRVLVGIAFAGGGTPVERWLVLGKNEVAPRLVLLIDAAGPDDLDALLTDLEPEWAELETPMADDKKKLSPEQAKDLVNQVVTQAMKEMGYEQDGDTPDFSGVGDGDLKGKIPELVYNLLQSAITEEGAGNAGQAAAGEEPAAAPTEASEEPDVVDLQAERKKREPREPSDFEKNISASLSGAVSGYMADNVVGEDDSEVKVDADFLKDHGPKLFANLFGAFVKSIVPEDMKVEVPVTTQGEDGSTRQVNMKLDVGEMLGKVLEPVERAANKAGNSGAEADAAVDEEEDEDED